jgi:hypothetical protein
MFGKRIPLFKLFGFKVNVDASWLILAVLVTWHYSFYLWRRCRDGIGADKP